MIRFRYWLNIELLRLAVAVLPDEAAKVALRMGISVGMNMLKEASEAEDDL